MCVQCLWSVTRPFHDTLSFVQNEENEGALLSVQHQEAEEQNDIWRGLVLVSVGGCVLLNLTSRLRKTHTRLISASPRASLAEGVLDPYVGR